jgi:hypothetical protein
MYAIINPIKNAIHLEENVGDERKNGFEWKVEKD